MVTSPFESISALESWLESNGSGSYESVVAIDDTAIAFAGLYPCQASQNHSAWISLFVHDEFSGRGIGTMMITALVATAHKSGMSRIQLHVVCDNQRAINLYRRFGFEIEGRHRHFSRRGDEFLDVFTMARVTTKGMTEYDKMDQLCSDLFGDAMSAAPSIQVALRDL